MACMPVSLLGVSTGSVHWSLLVVSTGPLLGVSTGPLLGVSTGPCWECPLVLVRSVIWSLLECPLVGPC